MLCCLEVAGSEDTEGLFLVCVSQTGMRLPVLCVRGQFRRTRIRCVTSFVFIRHPETVLRASCRTGSIFEACYDLLQTGDAYSAEEKLRARAVVWIDMASVS